jgi:CRISPR system Cascade subunit CasE
MPEMFLIRARLKPDASIAAIASLLLPAEPGARVGAAHRLVWSLFAGNAARRRDFLWREDVANNFYILAPQKPGESAIFDVQSKVFAPDLAAGDRLQFSLRANATTARKLAGSRARGKRADVVMARLYAAEERAAARPAVIQDAGAAWLVAQGARHGFSLSGAPAVDGYARLRLPRDGTGKIDISTLDFSGVLKITDPAAFLHALYHGFGHAKAFGCGLMLIRRAG